jgi:hypothetical protein
MEVKNLSTGKTVITLSEEERKQLLQAINRMGQTFQFQFMPVVQQLGKALQNANPAIREFINEAEKAREICQRLDPAFSGPAEEAQPVRTIDPVTGKSRLTSAFEEESFPLRQIVPGPGTKADWDESRG